MTVYGDASWWIACKITDDANHRAAVQVFDRVPDIQVLWTPWQRVEVFIHCASSNAQASSLSAKRAS